MHFNKYPLLSFLIFFIFVGNSAAQAAETGWLTNPKHPPLQVNLQLTGQSSADDKTVNALLSIKLDKDWKTYWRTPGEGGIAPKFKWQENSANIKAIDWFWPAPQRYTVQGAETLGYKELVQLPLVININDVNQASHLKGKLTIASCTNICVLTDYNINLPFDINSLTNNDDISFAFSQAMSAVPIVINEENIKTQKNNANITKLASFWDQTAQTVTVQVNNKVNWQAPDIFLETIGEQEVDVYFAKPEISTTANQLTAKFKVSSWSGEVDLSGTDLQITVVDNNIAVELNQRLTNQTAAQSTEQTTQSLASIFVIALIGGLILNIMPCVLPVLGMKLSSVLGVDRTQRSQIRMQFLASTAGILSSFWILAAFLLVLKFSGEALGWGIQFQNPYFIAVMVLITAVFAANMLGIFEIQLPSGMNTWLATTGGNSYVGHYLQGMFATLLATPCSAPFLGTAVAFALATSAWQLFAIFTALGLGMALPWLLIAAFPSIASLMPKPGTWMGTVKNFFALLILITCLWLISLLSSFIGDLVTGIIAVAVMLAFALLTVKKYGKQTFTYAFSAILVISGLTLFGGKITEQYGSGSVQDEIAWQPLDLELLQESVEAGKVVFVDITAEWCVTCKANKVGVLLQNPVNDLLQQKDVIAMKGDWTVRSDEVTAYLQSFDRYGVPFNIVYGPNAKNGIELSTILNNDDVLDAMNKAKIQ